MKLKSNWRAVLRHAWSVRLLALSIVLSALEVGISIVADSPPFGLPKKTFAVLAILVSIAAGIARLVAQKPLSPGDDA